MITCGSTRNTAPDYLHVVAAAIQDEAGRVLLTRRHLRSHQGGLWEFPGGKVEAGEDAVQALARELREELGIMPTALRPLIRVPHRYPERAVLLDVWRVDAFSGSPRACEGQPLVWAAPDDLLQIPMPAANRPVANAVRLPSRYLITPEPGETALFLGKLESALGQGLRLIQLRARQVADNAFRQLVRDCVSLCRGHGAQLLLNAEPELAMELGAHGVHLTSARLQGLERRPLPIDRWVAASCHDVEELARAARLGVDFAVLSPVRPTRSHPGAQPLGWDTFGALVDSCPFPVYALGGVGPEHLPSAHTHGGQGIAAMGALWPE
jgi:8-oxo-dGTP diphosphatase